MKFADGSELIAPLELMTDEERAYFRGQMERRKGELDSREDKVDRRES